jgi:hypothetical protein
LPLPTFLREIWAFFVLREIWAFFVAERRPDFSRAF